MNQLKIILAIMLMICLFKMPYGYYQVVRVVAMIGFAILAYDAFKMDQVIVGIVYIGLAILFQPLIKIALGREIWNIVDAAVALFLVVSMFMYGDKSEPSNEIK